MIEYIINPNLSTVNWQRISEMFSLVNWDIRQAEEIKRSFQASSFVLFAKKNDQIIGFGRTVDDAKYYALIVDVVIDPDYQKQGIGKSIVEQLTQCLKGYNFITLTAAPAKEGFYKKLGWKKQKSAYIWPKDQKQTEEHCEKEE